MTEQRTTQEQILAAAREEFLEKGYEAAALREISRKAGVTTGALYGYFKNKQELFGALVDEEYHRLPRMYDEILEQFSRLPPERQMSDMQSYTVLGMSRMVDYIYGHWTAFRLILCCSEGTPYTGLVEEMTRRDVQATDDYSRTSREAGVTLPAVNPTLERMLTNGMFSIFFEMVRQDLPRAETEQYISQLLQFYTGGWEKLWGV